MPETAPASDLLIGLPVFLHWPIAKSTQAGREQARADYYREIGRRLQQRINVLFADGYLVALIAQRKNSLQLINSLADGLMIHDNSRRISLFNQAAERITGFRREDVLGRDCHEVFGPDGLCGGQCTFKEESSGLAVDREYQINITTANGEPRLVRMSVTPTEAHEGWPGGVIASLRDITEINELRWQLKEKYNFHGMVGVSPAMQEVFQTIRQVVTSEYPILITGESGTGKELVANAIHNESRRSGAPFVPINCGALPENILESELFGHVRGAFTGAIRDKKGRFEMADGGTLFLDEVGELTPAFQVKLLRVLQENRFERVGGEQSIQVDVRIISATNRSLAALIKEGNFREDLFYRLSVVPIMLPPLRERREDIPALVTHLLQDIRRETGKKELVVSQKAIGQLLSYDWPGNVRELINTLRYAAVRCSRKSILLKDLPPEIRQARAESHIPLPSEAAEIASPLKKEYSRGKLDFDEVRNALRVAKGNKVQAAKILGVGRATLYRFLNRHPDCE
ncbi:MAG: sigma 54-interacting transcriptional regulator [Desulfobacterales bacterium]|nr:MAG: sigma 54-interacting transcriptional regulator [Desulfobacterales bacterium]